MSPFVHVATGADFASPFANAGDKGLGYINSDVTLYLHRLPVTRWIGFDVVNHHATDGVAIGECWLYDEKGPIGTSTVAALAQRKPMTNAAAAVAETYARCRRISGRAFSAAPCLAKIFAIRSGAKFMSTNAGAVLATS